MEAADAGEQLRDGGRRPVSPSAAGSYVVMRTFVHGGGADSWIYTRSGPRVINLDPRRVRLCGAPTPR